MKSAIFIREYEPKDYGDLTQAGYPFGTAEWGNTYKELKLKMVNALERSEQKKFVAYSLTDEKAVGVVTLKRITENMWGVWNIFVSPDYRRRGISFSLYEKSFDYLRKNGAKKAIGSVEVTNMPSRKSIEKTWDGFLSQRFFEYQGNARMPHIYRNFQKSEARKSRFSDQGVLYEIYRHCTHEDWRTFLEIDSDNFLQRFIEPKHYRGPLGILFQKQTLVFESEDEHVKGYAIAPTPRWPLRRSAEKLYFFMSPQLSLDEARTTIISMLNLKARRGLRKIRIFTINKNEKLLNEVSEMLCGDFGFKAFQHMVPVRKL